LKCDIKRLKRVEVKIKKINNNKSLITHAMRLINHEFTLSESFVWLIT
jgi:hypothetical protein